MKADQTIGGTALNLLAPAIVLFLVNIVFQQNTLNLRYDAPSWFMLFQTDFASARKPKPATSPLAAPLEVVSA